MKRTLLLVLFGFASVIHLSKIGEFRKYFPLERSQLEQFLSATRAEELSRFYISVWT